MCPGLSKDKRKEAAYNFAKSLEAIMVKMTMSSRAEIFFRALFPLNLYYSYIYLVCLTSEKGRLSGTSTDRVMLYLDVSIRMLFEMIIQIFMCVYEHSIKIKSGDNKNIEISAE